jgi:hypothetical protein
MIQRLTLKQDPAIKNKVIEFKITGKIANYILNKMGWDMSGTTIPLPFIVFIFYLYGDKANADELKLVRVHEFQHALQSQETGFFLIWWAKYIWSDIVQLYKWHTISDMYYHNVFELAAYTYEWAVKNGSIPMPEWA